MNYKVQLINHELGKGCLFGLVQGGSGKTYATSRYHARGYHIAELKPEEYERAADDISRGWQRALCRWIPHFVPDAPVPETATTVEENMIACDALREELSTLPVSELHIRAKRAGVALGPIRKKSGIIGAILAGSAVAQFI